MTWINGEKIKRKKLTKHYIKFDGGKSNLNQKRNNEK